MKFSAFFFLKLMLVVPEKIETLVQWALDPSNNVTIKDIKSVTEKIIKLDEKRVEHIHIIADFDMTLTKYWVDGKRNMSSHGVMEHSSMLPGDIKNKMNKLYAKYYPLEISHDITQEEKVKYMEEWWTKAHEHIIEAKITKQNIKQAVKECTIAFRPLLKEFIAIATQRKIPLLVFSAGLADVIKEVLLKEPGYWTEDMDIVSNLMKFENDICVGFENRLVHVMNKNEAGLPPKVHHDKVVNRENVILMVY